MKLSAILVAATLSLAAVSAQADDRVDNYNEAPSAAAMATDLLLIRPVSLVATVLGTGLFLVQLPLSIIIGEPPAEPARRLVAEPAAYTFRRPLGHMD